MHQTPFSRRWFLQHLRLVAAGLLTGVVAVAFRRALESAAEARPWLISQTGPVWLGLLASLAFSLGTILPAVWLVRGLCPEAAGSGIPQVKGLARHPGPIRWARLLLVKFASGVLGIGGGLALGREGPTVQSGAALGEMLGGVGGVTPGERRHLLLFGAGAGLAGAFNAPLAGAIFVFEELGDDLKPTTCTAALLTTFGADLVCRSLTTQYPQLGTYSAAPPDFALLPFFLLVGWLGGVLGAMFNQSLLAAVRLSKRLRGWMMPLAVALAVGLLGWLDSRWVGGGDAILQQLRRGGMELSVALGLLGLRFGLTVSCYAVGTAGGLFAPLLVLGGLLGCCVGETAGLPDHSALALVGMAALFTGSVRTPLTGVILLIEMSGAYSLTVPLVGASLLAKLTADALGDRPIYDALLEDFPLTPTPPRSPDRG